MTAPTVSRKPETPTHGLGEIIRAHRLFIGLSQESMAERVGKDLGDYMHIEDGTLACPVGLLGQVERLADNFGIAVDSILRYAAKNHGATLVVKVTDQPGDEWDRLVAGRAAVEADAAAPITIRVGEVDDERTTR